MFFTYTPEQVGGILIFKKPSGSYFSNQSFYGDFSIDIHQRKKDELLLIQISSIKDGTTQRIISNYELKVIPHPENDKYFIITEKNPSTD